MKKAFAVFFGLLVVWMQITVAVPTSQAAASAPCTCCDCAQTDCCVAPAAPVSQSQTPAVPSRSTVDKQFSLLFATPVLWVLPDAVAGSFSASDSSPLLAAGRPLYERHCALLI